MRILNRSFTKRDFGPFFIVNRNIQGDAMATISIELETPDEWVLVDDAGEDFILQSLAPIEVTFSDSVPDEESAYHYVPPREIFRRIGTEDCYVRSSFITSVVVTF